MIRVNGETLRAFFLTGKLLEMEFFFGHLKIRRGAISLTNGAPPLRPAGEQKAQAPLILLNWKRFFLT